MASSVSMPIKEVFLYDNGYAVFHREAEITGEDVVGYKCASFIHSVHSIQFDLIQFDLIQYI